MPCTDLRFLVVEDHEFQRTALEQLLATLGAKAVYSAEDGLAAMQVVRDPDRPVDIVISDLSMPGMDGMEFVRHLSESGARIALILLSSVEKDLLASVANMVHAYEVNLLGIVPKPATAAKLTPLFELYRSAMPDVPLPDDSFSLDEIAQAWAQDEFETWFEPTVDLASGTIRGMAAVPRWRHPKQGVIGPALFMASMQSRGLGDDLVWLMLRKSAAECCKWNDLGYPLTVSVNLALSNLTEPNLALRIQQICDREGLNPAHMVLTVTEQSLDTGQAKALENLARLRMLGYGLGIEEFGSGRMAVEDLALVNFTELKIVSTYVTGADSDEAVRAGLAIGLDVASRLKLKTIAGGISSKHEWNLLHDWGCDWGQGPFISHPLQAGAVPAWLNRRHAPQPQLPVAAAP